MTDLELVALRTKYNASETAKKNIDCANRDLKCVRNDERVSHIVNDLAGCFATLNAAEIKLALVTQVEATLIKFKKAFEDL